jgi:molybdopterin-guanine dinucleotide biosynthesis protein A
MKAENISGVILVGGENKRFNGVIKSNLIIGGRTILDRIVGTISDLFGEIIIVTNTPDKFGNYSSFRFTGDQYSNMGPLAGIHAGMKASALRSVFVFAGDMPFLDKEIIERQIDEYLRIKPLILVPKVNGLIEPLHSIYSNQLLPVLEEYLISDKRPAVRDFYNNTDVSYLKLTDSGKTRKAFMNINTPDEATDAEKMTY